MKQSAPKIALLSAAVVAVAALVWLVRPGSSNTAATENASVTPRTIRWYVVHAREYKEYNDQLLSFAQHLSDKTGGALKIEFAYSGIGSGWRDGQAEADGLKRILADEADISQLGADTLGADVVLAPNMFRNYDHAEAVWRGPVGEKLLANVSLKSSGKLEALAFSYSGGYRALVGTRAIHSADDLTGAKISLGSGSPSVDDQWLLEMGAQAAMEETGEKHDFPDERSKVAGTVKKISEALSAGKVDLFSVEINGLAFIESKYQQLEAKPLYVNLTNHSMYVTSIVANQKFLASLEPGLRNVLIEETKEMALAERRLSAELATRNLELFTSKYGHTVVPFPEGAQQRFKAAADAVQARHPEWAEIIREIQSANEIPLLASAATGAKH